MKRPVRIGVIAAAGKGTRAYPRTTFIPKPLFTFEDESILEKNVCLMFFTLKVKKLYIIVGHLKEVVIEEIDRIRKKYPEFDIQTSPWTQKGLAADIASLRTVVDGDFVVILGDEFYYKTDHQVLLRDWSKFSRAQALIAVLNSALLSDIRKNYSVELEGSRVKNLVEKPENPPNNLLGLGTYVFSTEYFKKFLETPPSKRSGVVELTDVIDHMARSTGQVYSTRLNGRYFNINSLADYYTANYLIRSEKFNSYKISLIVPALNNKATLPDVIKDFQTHVHEIVLVDMGSRNPPQIAPSGRSGKKQAGNLAKIRKVQGSAEVSSIHNAQAVYSAMLDCSGDIIVLAPSDGSFRSRDLPKLLEYLKDCDMVVGTRTTRQLIEQGSNLRPLYRWLNVALGKLVEIFWWDQEPRFTDIGCMYRAVWKESFKKIAADLTAKDRTYFTEMMIEIVRYHMRCIEIPVSYYRMYGAAQSETRTELWKYFFSILFLIFSRRFRFISAIGRLFQR